MSFRQPAYELRGSRKFWGLGEKLMEIGMSPLAAKLIRGHILVYPEPLRDAANDRDGKRW